MPVADNTVPVPAPDEVFVDRYRRITSRWYPFVKRLFESLRTTANAVDAVQVDVDQINAQYTISVNANGRVTGAIKLDGSGALSTVSVLADKFIIVHPAADATTIQAFIVGLVNGISTVGINGNLVVDDTISARHIVAGSIDTEHIAAGSITATEIAADAVNATHIAAGSITANEIAADAVNATHLNVTDLSAVTSNMGTLTVGKIQSADGNFLVDATNKRIRIVSV